VSPRAKPHRKLRVLLLNHPALAAPDSAEGASEEEQAVSTEIAGPWSPSRKEMRPAEKLVPFPVTV